jgi:hypothetical protein
MAILNKLGAGGLVSAAGIVLPFVRPTHKYLNRRSGEPATSDAEIVSYEGFALPNYQLFIYGALMLAAALELSGFVAGVVSSIAGGASEDLRPLIVLAVAFSSAIVSYFLGTWIGSRARRRPLIVLLATVAVGRLIAAVADVVVVSPHDFREVLGTDKTGATIAVVLLGALAQALLFGLIFGGLGVWRGRRSRHARYLRHLLDRLPNETQETILALAYEEARAASPSLPTAVSAASPAPG